MRGAGSGTTGTNPSSSLIKKTTKKSRRKTRSKTRKPKYLSLRLQFSADRKVRESSEMPSSTITATTTTTTTTTSSTSDQHQPQLDFFPLHRENLVAEKDAHDENMAYLFSAADGGATTLTGLLGAAASTSSSDGDNKNRSTTTLSPSASLTYAYGRRNRDSEEEVALVRTAMRNKEREPSEEKWVRYSEVVERRAEDQEVSSCAADHLRCWRRNLRLSLKLDYQEILNAWSDKGPLYIHSPQTVPDIHDDFLASQLSNGISDGWGSSGGCVWRVPELVKSKENEKTPPRLIKVKEELQQEQAVVAGENLNLKVGQREASVQRYKEKRQNRLFSKRIRYQVRKLNAEKRPRLKGRFVKRS